jgi:nucleoid-associated protein YgaU
MGVTISLQPAAAHHPPAHYTVRPGDSLSKIARHEYGSAADWPALWWVNRHRLPNPNVIVAGQRLRLSGWHPRRAWLDRAALAAIPAPPPVPRAAAAAPAAAPAASAAADTSTGTGQAPAAAVGSAGGVNWSAIADCESGGNWSADTGNGFYGGLQFTEQTWLGYGGGQYAQWANLASPAQQIAVGQRVLAGQGIGAWPVCGARG